MTVSKLLLLTVVALAAISCATRQDPNSNSTSNPSAPISSGAATPGPISEETAVPVTLPVLNALFADEAFKAELKSKLQLSEEQIARLQQEAQEEVNRLRQMNAELAPGGAAEARQQASQTIEAVVGPQKAAELFALVRDHWVRGDEEIEAGAKEAEVTMLPGPNAIPPDTRIVVNIPAYRMDVFHNGSLVKSYKVGIGYPRFPLPVGLRKAQTIIFNPTWTPPDEPWVARMKNVSAGTKVPAGSPLNPLGPIKIPIGMPSLIHGGKPLSKIGTFASHGCVGLTNSQVKDFAQKLAQAGDKDISEKTIASYLRNKTRTQVVKLDEPIPVELRYETIVVEDGKLHIYRDVYDQNTNTEENLRTVLTKHGITLEDLSEDERAEILEALNAMSAHPKKPTPAKLGTTKASPTASPSDLYNERTEKTEPTPKKPIGKNQKEVVLEADALAGKGYPAPVELDSGTGKRKD